jgi:uncharacterized protein YeaO (DUF488 family)
MAITTSYFAVAKHLEGTKISIARFNHPRVRNGIDEVIDSFAPSVELLRDYKDESIDWSQYRRRYTTEQRRHYKENPEDFEGLLERAEEEDLVLLCYEKYEGRRTKCHRLILFDILKKVADSEDYAVDFIEEQPYVRPS